MINQALIEHLSQLKQRGLHRKRLLSGVDKEIINFSSNDYLSLSEEWCIRNAFQKGFAHHASGSGGSMVICGYHQSHRELECAFSQALGVDDALLFSSGYAANLGVVSLFAHFNAHFFIDKGAHASFYDGLRLTNSLYTRYPHNDLQNLASKLQSSHSNPVVIAESVFSMSGQETDLRKLSNLCVHYGTDCVVDEAHAFGILGEQGLGAVKQYGLSQQEIPLRIIPLGKAFAFQGAVVAGQSEWIDALLQLARSHIYSTAVSPALAYGIRETLAFMLKAEDRRQKLRDLIAYFQRAIKESPLKWRNSSTPIQQLQLGCPHKALAYANELRARGLFCQAMREPTVSKKDTGLRVILNYHHEPEDVDKLLIELERIRWMAHKKPAIVNS
ncbi:MULTISPECIES: aminotransferase class I/II-fold pyridoxal phosphate-dependent enzyme [Legionella]|uniref:8-amino-7-oxononanoate synthase n=1 Tax=Legionella maceachernii TaxID=466 RepID=A0A0W0VYB9_9GAMM|nr:aminotransferase class I/II-fold pyridoxal phosphate-dependent enzyme [Legionella maceachernii]KTD25100.1 8-amino-7-oxononanoate synthase [Legionella maceachernii]SKA28702.1 8-amino-7-oxononanoate synthase [Legionella maceachernii]SUP02480.1 8-amino-7-oxononanoate synthase [Legionella maceachernii]